MPAGPPAGFDGKTLIHPCQVDPCNRIFAPDQDELDQAARIVEAFQGAERLGRGIVTVDGRMVEHLHVEEAQRTLARAAAIASLSSERCGPSTQGEEAR